ncbi:hypothetical protein LCGC14_2874850, partial [marine sediment metagenome]
MLQNQTHRVRFQDADVQGIVDCPGQLAQTGAFDKMYPKPVADMINRMTAVWDQPEAINQLLGATDKVLGIWKSFQLYHPAYVMRNAFQNYFGLLMAGGSPRRASALFARHHQELKLLRDAIRTRNPAGLAGRSIPLGGGQAPLELLYRVGLGFNMTGTGRTAQEIPKRMGGRAWQQVHGAIFKANTWLEDTQKLTGWLSFMDQGMDAESAAMRMLTAMPDMSDLTMWEKKGFARLFPFYRWMRHNGALQLFHFLPQKPAFAASLPKLKNLAEGANPFLKGKVPEEIRPRWQQEQMAIQISGTKKEGLTFLPQSWLPFEEMLSWLGVVLEPEETARRTAASMRPGIRFGAELATGQNIFRRMPHKPLGSGGLM